MSCYIPYRQNVGTSCYARPPRNIGTSCYTRLRCPITSGNAKEISSTRVGSGTIAKRNCRLFTVVPVREDTCSIVRLVRFELD